MKVQVVDIMNKKINLTQKICMFIWVEFIHVIKFLK